MEKKITITVSEYVEEIYPTVWTKEGKIVKPWQRGINSKCQDAFMKGYALAMQQKPTKEESSIH